MWQKFCRIHLVLHSPGRCHHNLSLPQVFCPIISNMVGTEWHFSFETNSETKNVTLLTLTFWFRNRFRNQKCHTLLFIDTKIALDCIFVTLWFIWGLVSSLIFFFFSPLILVIFLHLGKSGWIWKQKAHYGHICEFVSPTKPNLLSYEGHKMSQRLK